MSARGRAMVLAGALAATGALPSTAGARSASVVPYPFADVWPAAIRFLRVDRDYPVKEKDEAAGYVLFEIAEGKRGYRAALELVKTADADGRPATQLVLSVQDLPRHYEASVLDKLTAKIRDERGPPPPPPARKTEPSPTPQPPKDGKSPGDLGNLPKPPTWGPAENR